MKILKLIAVFLLFSSFSKAQKIGIVDTNYILSQLPQYKEAEDRLNKLVAQWQNEIQTLQAEYDQKKATLENEKVLLVGDQLKQREKEVADLDKKIKGILASRFGAKGEINNSRANLAKPFQDQIWNAIKTISEKNSLGIVLDKTENNVLFLEKRYDYTEKVLNLLVKNQPDTKTKGNLKGNNAGAPVLNQNRKGMEGRSQQNSRSLQNKRSAAEDSRLQ